MCDRFRVFPGGGQTRASLRFGVSLISGPTASWLEGRNRRCELANTTRWHFEVVGNG